MEYWKEILAGLTASFGALALVSEKFRDTVTFWRTRESEAKKDAIDIKDKDLSFIERLQDYQRKELDNLLSQLETKTQEFERKIAEANKIIIQQTECNNKSKILIGKYRAHIRYLESLLSSNKVQFYKLEE